MSVTILHNPRCSKSRQTLELLEDRGGEINIVTYLDTPPDEEGLRDILSKLDMSPRQLMRKKEAAEAGLDDPALSDAELIRAMVKNPSVIERPIVLANDKARIGRPPESVLDIL
ncbi:MAG: arsenate reductase (glutaredoxin) [Rhodospirillales bacterium]|jgi:arsenate reductase (glutaredoxin)|nr:arsenate reductase (glutaredoxin) [Rhodospirillales bacterium]MBT4039383.1 arsenate reductase (glutaredoxin) [Rhodospirillales bacterium]MBT4627531.1 arsenate reductase (glutaredoxin) [Rhodospirillales bacterium]MBT5352933.1 arsenate reductase (glutaredoxin) [Rhodospirillales bacterium]MBT5520193.1 arsenate reductase (glutaredoxin) [Rhodospirillales bacterium]